MELFKIGGPNPDTNYLFMGMSPASPSLPGVDADARCVCRRGLC